MFSQYHEQVDEIIRKRKRIEFELQDGPSEFVKNLVLNMKLEEFEPSLGRVYSNNMSEACKTICKVCQAQVSLTGMRNHTRNNHKMTIHEYKEKYGNPKDQIVKMVYHKCGLCQADVLFNSDNIQNHVVRKHQYSLKEYNAEFIKTSPGRKMKKERKITPEENCVNTEFQLEANGVFDTLEEDDSFFDTL
jgi:hypothetical protein